MFLVCINLILIGLLFFCFFFLGDEMKRWIEMVFGSGKVLILYRKEIVKVGKVVMLLRVLVRVLRMILFELVLKKML